MRHHTLAKVHPFHDQAEHDALFNGFNGRLDDALSATTTIISLRISRVEIEFYERRLHQNPSPIPTEKSRCPLASALATSSHFLRLLAASGPESETLLISLMPFAPSEYAHQDFTPLGSLDRIYVYSDTLTELLVSTLSLKTSHTMHLNVSSTTSRRRIYRY